MIREYAPIPLIPAAWAMTVATMVYPGIDTYWIQHMHYFMLIFLTGFTALSWKKMGKDPVLDIWRKVIAAGIVFTGLGALSFTTNTYTYLMGTSSILYWFIAPGAALYLSSKHMDRYTELYSKLGIESGIATAVFLTGLVLSSPALQGIGIGAVAVAQTISIVKASELDS